MLQPQVDYVDIDVQINVPEMIVKRDGRVVAFDAERIETALKRCFNSLSRRPVVSTSELTQQVVNIVAAKYEQPTVEQIQDIVEMVLLAAGEYEAAKHYILYRAERAKLRLTRPIPENVRAAFAESDRYFPTDLQKFQFYDKYSRFNYELGRRETWVETVDRAVDYLKELSEYRLPTETYTRVHQAILDMRAMPSMRLLAMAGPAARRNNIAIYNCSYQPVESVDSFVEALIISMSGCGVGYSVERHYVENFPRIQRQLNFTPARHVVEDSAEGWADALRFGLETWFEGGDVHFDFSLVRPAGAPLRIKGGRASGPEPLRKMLDFVRARVLARQGSFLRPLDAHDIMCAVGGAAVSGGVRRTAMIALFDQDDTEMKTCKDGDFWRENSQRWNANNSAVWPARRLTQAEVAHYILDMVDTGRGEPGIFNRQAAIDARPERRALAEFGTNPCGEIILRPWEFCNLSSAVVRADDTYESLREKVELATIIAHDTVDGDVLPRPASPVEPELRRRAPPRRRSQRAVGRCACQRPRSAGALAAGGHRDEPADHRAVEHQPVGGDDVCQAVGQLVPAAEQLVRDSRALGAVLRPQRAGQHVHPDLQGTPGRRRADEPGKRPDAGNRRHVGRAFPGQIAGWGHHAHDAFGHRAVRILAAEQNLLDRAQPQRDDHLPSARGAGCDQVGVGKPEPHQRDDVPPGLRCAVRSDAVRRDFRGGVPAKARGFSGDRFLQNLASRRQGPDHRGAGSGLLGGDVRAGVLSHIDRINRMLRILSA